MSATVECGKQWELSAGSRHVSFVLGQLMRAVWLWSLPDIDQAHAYPTREMDVSDWFCLCRRVSTELEQWRLGLGKPFPKSHQSHRRKELRTVTSSMCRGGHLASLAKSAFCFGYFSVYKLCLQIILWHVYTLKLLQSYVDGCGGKFWMYDGPIFNFYHGRK